MVSHPKRERKKGRKEERSGEDSGEREREEKVEEREEGEEKEREEVKGRGEAWLSSSLFGYFEKFSKKINKRNVFAKNIKPFTGRGEKRGEGRRAVGEGGKEGEG